MKGRVVLIYRGFIGVGYENGGGYSVVELMGNEAEKGDVISGKLRGLGGQTLFNETQNVSMDHVIVQDFDCSEEHMVKLMRS